MSQPAAATSAKLTQKQVDSKYSKLSDIEHVLLRPGMYIGEVSKSIESVFTIDPDTMRISKRNCEYSPGFLKLFDEILTNAIDYSLEHDSVTQIKVSVDRATGELSVWNNGPGIPILKHSEHDLYIPEMIFGYMRTGSNYNEDKARVGGGMNGLGAKAVNVYSSKFTVETVDSDQQKKFIQTFSNNLSERTVPKVVSCKTKSYTKISWIPDYTRFKMKGLSGKKEDDTYSLLLKRVVDSIVSTPARVKMYFNGTLIKGKSLKDYTKYYFDDEASAGGDSGFGDVDVDDTASVATSSSSTLGFKRRVFYDTKTFGYTHNNKKVDLVWEIAIVEHDSFEQVSFVNGLCTTQGGTHVKYISDRIVAQLKDLIEPKLKHKETFKPALVREKLFVFVRSSIINPRFNSQTKEYLTTPVKDFHANYTIDETFAKKILRGTSILGNILEQAKFKEAQELKRKTDGSKKRNVFVPKLEDATFAGTGKSSRCTLLLTEGDSGKAFAMRVRPNNEEYGVFPLKGKGLNVRSATHTQLINNEEINYLKQILGLEQGKVYKNTSSLRYRRIMLLTDADTDAAHIRGLIINLFDTWWPSLLKLEPSFIVTLRTPIVKATCGKTRKEFLTEQDYETWKAGMNDAQLKRWRIHYYKGLGTSTKEDAKDIMKRINDLVLEYYYKDHSCSEAILKAFEKGVGPSGKNYTDVRKDWLKTYDRSICVDSKVKKLSFRDMINKELVHFSNYDNIRSIPNLVDGLKPSQRKIMHYCLEKLGGGRLVKVAQLSGYVSAETAYHHGEMSLQQAIVCLGQDFVGSNILGLLTPEGNFGTRLKGGADHASPRYIFTRLPESTSCLFDKRDSAVLDYLYDDGMKIEPEYFAPILPMVLVNGSQGIGTGYSTTIPSFKLDTIINNLRVLLEDDARETNQVSDGSDGGEITIRKMVPWFSDAWKGTVVADPSKPGVYVTRGLWTKKSSNKLLITELPIGTWITPYVEFLKSLCDEYKPMKAGDINPNAKHPLCGLLANVEYIKPSEDADENTDIQILVEFLNAKTLDNCNIEKDLKLTSSISTNNMYLFDSELTLQKYSSPEDILQDYYSVRVELYEKRRNHIIKVLTHELYVLTNKIQFIKDYISGDLRVSRVEESQVLKQLEDQEFYKVDDSYDYLLNLPIKSLTQNRISALENQCLGKRQELDYYATTNCYKLWLHDLDKLEATLGKTSTLNID